MSAKKTDNRESPVLAFLSGRGPNPISENKRSEAGPLEKKFLDEAMQEIAEQDRANERKATPNVADMLMAVMTAEESMVEFGKLIMPTR